MTRTKKNAVKQPLTRTQIETARTLLISLIEKGQIETAALETCAAVLKTYDAQLADPNFV